MANVKYKKGGLPLPPYGTMSEGFQTMLDTGPDVPIAFQPLDSDPVRKVAWQHFRDATKKLITDTLWPEWEPENQEWVGTAAGWMYDLTAVDLDIVVDLKANVLRASHPHTPLSDPATPRQVDFGRTEDDGPVFDQYHFYDTSLPKATIDHFADTFDQRGPEKFGTVHLQFKKIFQRPRPYQTVFLTGHATLNALRSISASTPSMCSGHCFQGVMGMGAVIERLLDEGATVSRGSLSALRQFAVDIGDRRVFAGIHYPSDNISSWIIAMRLANLVFSNLEVKAHLWKAISQQSRVYRAVSGVDIYRPALNHLVAAAADVSDIAAALPGC